MPQVACSDYNDVDIYSSSTNQWTTAVLSQARAILCGTSLRKQGLAFFAGGSLESGAGIYLYLNLHSCTSHSATFSAICFDWYSLCDCFGNSGQYCGHF